jgi:hypothetical protein
MYYGINQLSQLFHLKSLRLPDSFPHDIMHLFLENICPLLQEHWTGSDCFKNVEPADLGYHLAPHICEQVGLETAEVYKTLPSDFVGAIPNIRNSRYKAEFWPFWVQYLSPILLPN